VQGWPGTGKSRVLTEILLQAAALGQRVLFLGATSAALDQVLTRLGSRESVCPLRCLGADEQAESLPACIQRFTLAERVRYFREHTIPAARQTLQATRQAWEQRRRHGPLWERFANLIHQNNLLDQQLADLSSRQSRVAEEIEAELANTESCSSPSALQTRWLGCLARMHEHQAKIDSQLHEIRAKITQLDTEQKERETDLRNLLPVAQARQDRRWWTGAWWRGFAQGNLTERVEELQKRLDELHAGIDVLDQDLKTQTAERARVEEETQAERRRLAENDAQRRRAELDELATALARDRQMLQEKWHAASLELTPGTAAPTAWTVDAAQTAREAWQTSLQDDEQRVKAAELWAGALEDAVGSLPRELAACANVVAATTSALATDPNFGETASAPTFDLLVLDETHLVTESEFQALARRASRWVLVGEPAGDIEDAPPLRKGHPGKGPHSALRPSFFHRLWQHLHTDPSRLPYSWVQSARGLMCRLQPFTLGQENWTECERVADRPDIELRIMTAPRQPPQLVEVVFPATLPIHEAKHYVYREVGELAIQARGSGLRWSRGADRLRLEFPPTCDEPSLADAVSVPLEDGVRELVLPLALASGRDAERGVPWYTAALEFDPNAGWTSERAQAWIEDHLHRRYFDRTALLTVPHRSSPLLTAFVADLLFAGSWHRVDGATGSPARKEPAPVEFIAVPPLVNGPERRSSEWGGSNATATATMADPRTRLRTIKGGAGLEVDLSDPRRLDQVPNDLRTVLPGQGLVNYLEARTVVRTLEGLVTDPAFQAASETWQRTMACDRAGAGCAPSSEPLRPGQPRSHGPAVAVMALYPAQVELIRLLIQRSAILAGCRLTVEVGLPSSFSQRECLALLVSLTRSHTHRAVSYGEGPQALRTALTRASGRILLFGDPGTMIRRSQWQGPLDHLDETSAQREQAIITRLVAYLQGHGPHPQAFCLHEGRA
jgi:hypothetical protein